MSVFFKRCLKIRKPIIGNTRHKSYLKKKPPWNVLFFGTDAFSVYSLKALYSEFKNGAVVKNLEIVTTIKEKMNPVRRYADKHNLCIHKWPIEVNETTFDVGVVVSFGHLIPGCIIKQFHFGMLNVHASLLPRWRGAAPIIYTLAKGDKEAGVTIMRIKPKHFDIGEILMQAKIPISNDMKMPDLHESLGNLGAECLVETLQNLSDLLCKAKPQHKDGVTFAPKVTPEFAVVRWEKMTSKEVYNLDRAVSGLFSLTSMWNGVPVKLLNVAAVTECSNSELSASNEAPFKPGFIIYNKKSKTLRVLCAKGTWIAVEKIGVFGKKIMTASDFNNGYIKKEPLESRYFG